MLISSVPPCFTIIFLHLRLCDERCYLFITLYSQASVEKVKSLRFAKPPSEVPERMAKIKITTNHCGPWIDMFWLNNLFSVR